MSGNDIDNTSSTGPIKVIVKQDGIGRTGGIVLGVFAGCGFGVAVMAVILMLCRDHDIRDEWRSTRAQYDNSAIDVQNHYDKERNHVIELEARLKILGDEVQEMKHERR